MKNIILKEITLENFRAQNAHHVFGDNENRVSGRNKSGKSSIISAFNWVLTGYCDANSPQNTNLFDNRQEITPETPVATVKALLNIDGEDYLIQRSAKAKFVRKRGTDTFEKASSDEYSYSIDNIERSATDFRDWVSEHIAPEDMVRFVIDGSYFITSMFDDKKKSRQLIERVVGTVTRDEMKGDYSDIEELLNKYTLDEIDTRAQNMAKGINDRLNEIPAIIKNKENEIAEIEQTDFNAIEKEIGELEQRRSDLDRRMTDLTKRIQPQLDAKYKAEQARQMKVDVLDKAYSEWMRSFDARKQNLLNEINAIRQQNDKSKSEHDDAIQRRDRAQQQRETKINLLENAQQKRLALLKERDDEKTRVFDASTAVCPYCGHQLDGDKFQEEVNKFEEKRRLAINEIVVKGKATAEDIKRLEAEIKECESVINAPIPEIIYQSTKKLEQQVSDLASIDTSKTAFLATEQGKTLLADIESVVIPEVVMPKNDEIVAAKKEVNDHLTPLYERRGLKSRLESIKSSVNELRTEQKEKGAELAKYERQRQLVKDYKQEQMEILSHKVNDGLKFSRIEVWSQQKDGTTVPDLVLKDAKGVNFATTNGASRIVTTCDVQRFFCNNLGVNMPCFIDESAVVDEENLPHLDGTQMFYMFRADTSLKVESK